MTTLMLSFLLLAGAQAPEWSRVTSLSGGDEVRVELAAGSVSGPFIAATADAITMRVGGRETTLNRTSVKTVQRRAAKSNRSRNVGIGLIAGMGAGALIYGGTCKGNCMAEGAAVWTAPLGLAGAITGAAWPTGGWQTIYRR